MSIQKFSAGTQSIAIVLSISIALSLSPASALATSSSRETRVFIEQDCPTQSGAAIAPLLLAALTFLIPKVIDVGVSLANQALQEKKKEEEKKNEAVSTAGLHAVDNFYVSDKTADSQPGLKQSLQGACLVVVRGNFSKRTSPSSTPLTQSECDKHVVKGFREEGLCNWLATKGLLAHSKGDDPVHIYLESQFEFSPDGTSFRVVPKYSYYGRSLTSAQGKGNYDLTYTFSFESASAGQTVTPFGLAILPFLRMNKPTTLQGEALEGKTSGWTPTLAMTEPQLAAVRSVKEAFEGKTALAERITDLDKEIAILIDAMKTLITPLLAMPAPAVPADETVFKFALNELKRPKERDKAKVTEVKQLAEEGVARVAERKTARGSQQAKTKEIDDWMAGKTKFGALNIKVTILEQPHLAQNKFLMTVADIFANSQTDLKQLATQTATQALGLQSKDAIQQKLEDKNKLLNEADTALATAKDAEKALQNASEAERNQKETALRVAKRNANVAFAKAGFSLGDLPYQDSYPVVGGP